MNQLHIISFLLITYLNVSNPFNVSPVPNYVFSEPALQTGLSKFGTSLFGFSVTLRKSRYGPIINCKKLDFLLK